jgi:hypothetical protein
VTSTARGDLHPKPIVGKRLGAVDTSAPAQCVKDVRDAIDSRPRWRERTVERLSQIQTMHDGFDDASGDELVDPHRPEHRRPDEPRIHPTRPLHRPGEARHAAIQDLRTRLARGDVPGGSVRQRRNQIPGLIEERHPVEYGFETRLVAQQGVDHVHREAEMTGQFQDGPVRNRVNGDEQRRARPLAGTQRPQHLRHGIEFTSKRSLSRYAVTREGHDGMPSVSWRGACA